jgi:hypothetical protein
MPITGLGWNYGMLREGFKIWEKGCFWLSGRPCCSNPTGEPIFEIQLSSSAPPSFLLVAELQSRDGAKGRRKVIRN